MPSHLSVEELEEQLAEVEAERDYLSSLVGAFMTGDVPKKASLQHFIFAQWGRNRLKDQRTRPALLNNADGT